MKKYIYLLFRVWSIIFVLSYGTSSVYANITSHPRLLLKKGEEKDIQLMIQKYPNMNAVHQYIIDQCNKILEEPTLQRIKQGKRLLAVSRIALQRSYFLSYAFRMTGKQEYAARAEKELLAISNFTDWNPIHFLDVGEMVMAAAIGYDWLYDYLPATTLKQIRTAILEKGFKPAGNKQYNGFYERDNNWNQVCNTGLVLGALAIYEDATQESKQIIDKAIQTIPLTMKAYEPDGAYQEGFGYWGYGTGFEVIMLAALESALGTDYGLSKNSSFMRSPHFMQFMTAPSGWCYNFCDSGRKINLNEGMFWFAAKKNDPSLLWYEYSYLAQLQRYVGSGTERLIPNILIFSKDLNLDKIEKPQGNFWISRGAKPLFVYRSGWERKDDTYLGIVAGSPSAPHGHMDAGSFIYEKNGVRWAIELGLQSYYTLESAGIDLWNSSQEGQRWNVFRLGNTGHSTLTINQKHHLVNGNPQITRTYQTPSCKGAEVDLSSIFSNSVKKAIRKITLDGNDDLTIYDKIMTSDTTAAVMWVMVTPAESRIISKNQIEITKDGHKMLMTVDAPIDIEMKLWNNRPVAQYDQDNPGTMRIGFETVLPAKSDITLKVTLAEYK